MTNYLIIDDEPIAHRIIESYCEKLPQLHKQGNCFNAAEALQRLQQETVDLLFLDINMPGITGFELLRSLPQPPKVIVTSAYQEYALEGYELNICDYLLKPFSFDRFLKAINKALIEQAVGRMPIEQSTSTERMFIKGDKKWHQVWLKDILYIEAYGNYARIHLSDQIIISPQIISELEQILPAARFIRVHKSFLVSLDKVNTIERNGLEIGSARIPVGQTYKLRLQHLLK